METVTSLWWRIPQPIRVVLVAPLILVLLVPPAVILLFHFLRSPRQFLKHVKPDDLPPDPRYDVSSKWADKAAEYREGLEKG